MIDKKASAHPAATRRVVWIAATWLLVALNALQFIATYQIQLRGMAHHHSTPSPSAQHPHPSSQHFHGGLAHHRHAYAFDTEVASAQWLNPAAHVHAEATESSGSNAGVWSGLYFLPASQASSGLNIRKAQPPSPPRIFYSSFHPALLDRPPAVSI